MKRLKGFERFWQALPAGAVAALLAVLPPQGAHATDGVIQINQARALAGGVTAGDTPGFPVTISEPGSYILTSNLDVTGHVTPASVNAIEVTGSGATIDLNNFAILGPTVCSGYPVSSCTPTGTGVGILFTSMVGQVMNGVISGMGYRGIDMSAATLGWVREVGVFNSGENGIVVPTGSLVKGVTAVSNGGVGIYLVSGKIAESLVTNNGSHGIEAGGNAHIRDTVSNGNGGSGISLASVSLVEDCTASYNTDAGITNSLGGVVRGSVASSNVTDGIHVGSAATVTHNNASGNAGDGIEAGANSTVVGNTVSSNGGYGLNLGSGTGYQGNVVNGNTTGTVNGASLVEMGGNVCGGNATCP